METSASFEARYAPLSYPTSGLTLELICNVGAVPLLTGEDEGWKLLDTPAYGSFVPLSPVVGITHLSIQGVSIDCGA